MYLISPHKKQYKANLHSHSTLSDGRKTPEQLKEMYKNKGYSILSITDHNFCHKHPEMTDDDFIMITGYETEIKADYGEDRNNPYNKSIHINLFARDPENDSFYWYHPSYFVYMTKEEQDLLTKSGPQRPREFTPEFISEFVQTAKECGYLASLNHPTWSNLSDEDVLKFDGFFSMEMCNFSACSDCHEHNDGLYDKLLIAGKRIFCHGSDDNHNRHPENSPAFDSFGAFTMIMPDEFTYDSIFDAMEKGEMYSSTGPTFTEVSIEGNKLHVECSEVVKIAISNGTCIRKKVWADPGKTITSADFEIPEVSRYIRVTIIDENGNHADTRGYFRDELGL